MSATGYTAWAVTAGEQPTTAYWNMLGTNDASFNSGAGFNDGAIVSRHLGAGLIVPPVASNPYKFHAYLGSGQATGTGGFFLVNIDTKVYDTSNNFNTSTHLFTAPVPGYYVFTAMWQCLSQTGAPKLASLTKNSSSSEFIRICEIPNTTGNITIGGTVMIPLVQGDTIGFIGYSTENKTVNNSSVTTYFQGYLSSAT